MDNEGVCQMNLEKLRKEVSGLCTVKTKFTCDSRLSRICPAYIINQGLSSYKILILNSLSNEETIQVEAHELAHLLLAHLNPGLISFTPKGTRPIDWLKEAVNNTISHKTIIDILLTDYNISSDVHLAGLSSSINGISKQIEKCYCLPDLIKVRLGVILFDIERTLPNSEVEVARVSSMNSRVREALVASRNHLSLISTKMERAAQYQEVRNFIESIWCKPEPLFS